MVAALAKQYSETPLSFLDPSQQKAGKMPIERDLDTTNEPLIRTAALVACFGLLFGFGISSIAGVLTLLASDFALDAAGQELLVAALIVACFFGAVLAAPLSARYGRRPTMWLAALSALLGYALMLTEPDYMRLIMIRFVLGFSVGLSSMVVPMYAAEITPAKHRGAVVALFQLAITAGILLAYGVALLFIDQWTWASILSVGLLPAAGACVLLLTLPESPVWLVTRKRRADALSAIQNISHACVPRRAIVSVLALCGGLFVLQNLSGIDGIIYYAPHIFQTLGFSAGTASLAATFGLGLVNFLATLVALRLVDSAGRRPLLIWGSAAMIVGMAMVIAASVFHWSWMGLVGLGLFIMAFAVSLGPLPYVMMSELFPASMRETGIAMASSISWLFNAFIAFTFLSFVNLIGLTWVMTFFMAVCVVSLCVGLIFLPETRRVPLTVIDQHVMHGRPLRQLGRAARSD